MPSRARSNATRLSYSRPPAPLLDKRGTPAIIAGESAMKKLLAAACVSCVILAPVSAAVEYQAVPDWLKLPAGKTQLGSMHGDIAVSSRDEVYVSVEDEK